MKKLLLLTIVLSAALLLPAAPAIAKSKSKKTAPAATVSTTDKISAVHLTSITVSVHSPPTSKQYKVTPATKITVNGQPGTLSSLATGMEVSVTTATDPTTAETIDAKSAKK
jgi:hypothetical protein